ncbi:DUF3140 domain-containing protein [Sphingomonas sp. HF-S4]|uniref:DUF3140 domain-containing protein n=1 Tax=Sphingomonas agrestis TaxID=3080540 RepID=A0ABU3Y9P4_9SPHN|nr:DUF3140 domain-containing protein [Sphingomonas sp. HF-S4]MDV3457867.1 DUF3140 domain-containing protein [Sphingomonas sp. HF-S4]
MTKDDDDHAQVYAHFHDAVNMAPAEIEQWLETEESRKVGFKRDGGESVGHASGRRIVQILRTRKAELDGGDYAHMRKVVGFVKRHRAQGPHDEFKVPTSRWRYSLMNWGHDPLKD